jgi:hypothetical protein
VYESTQERQTLLSSLCQENLRFSTFHERRIDRVTKLLPALAYSQVSLALAFSLLQPLISR